MNLQEKNASPRNHSLPRSHTFGQPSFGLPSFRFLPELTSQTQQQNAEIPLPEEENNGDNATRFSAGTKRGRELVGDPNNSSREGEPAPKRIKSGPPPVYRDIICIVGTGTLAIRFAALILTQPDVEIHVYDPEKKLQLSYLGTLRKDVGVLGQVNPDLDYRVHFFSELVFALSSASLVVEATDGGKAAVADLWRAIEDTALPDTLLWKATTKTSVSSATGRMRNGHRVVAVRLPNESVKLPLVEVQPSAFLKPQFLDRTLQYLEKLGLRPVVVKKELVPSITDHLMQAIFREACQLYKDEIVSIKALDDIVKHSLGPLLSAQGLFEVLHAAGGQRGVAGFVALNESFIRLSHAQNVRCAPSLADAAYDSLIANVTVEAASTYGMGDTQNRDQRLQAVTNAMSSIPEPTFRPMHVELPKDRSKAKSVRHNNPAGIQRASAPVVRLPSVPFSRPEKPDAAPLHVANHAEQHQGFSFDTQQGEIYSGLLHQQHSLLGAMQTSTMSSPIPPVATSFAEGGPMSSYWQNAAQIGYHAHQCPATATSGLDTVSNNEQPGALVKAANPYQMMPTGIQYMPLQMTAVTPYCGPVFSNAGGIGPLYYALDLDSNSSSSTGGAGHGSKPAYRISVPPPFGTSNYSSGGSETQACAVRQKNAPLHGEYITRQESHVPRSCKLQDIARGRASKFGDKLLYKVSDYRLSEPEHRCVRDKRADWVGGLLMPLSATKKQRVALRDGTMTFNPHTMQIR